MKSLIMLSLITLYSARASFYHLINKEIPV